MTRETFYNDVFDAQRHFRLLMDSMARPGKLNVLNDVRVDPPAPFNHASALIGLSLLNADVTFCVAQNAETIDRYFIVNVSAQPTTADAADYLFLPGDASPDALEIAKVGTLAYPDTSATVIIDVALLSLEPQPDSLCFTLEGPGVNGQATVYVQGLNPALLHTLTDKNSEYPLGIDAFLTDGAGRICGIPRSNHVQVAELLPG